LALATIGSAILTAWELANVRDLAHWVSSWWFPVYGIPLAIVVAAKASADPVRQRQ
jgi:hypothetical protein